METVNDEIAQRVAKRSQENTDLKEMAQKLYSMRFYDSNSWESHRIGSLLEEYAKLFLPDLLELFNAVWCEQKDQRRPYCDIDWSLEKFNGKKIGRDGEEEDGYSVRAIVIDLHSSCAGCTRFLLIHEGDKYFQKIHARAVYKQGDDKDELKSISWYKRRKFSLDYVKKLGDSYGDCRDDGYVITAEQWLDGEWKIDKLFPRGFQTLTSSILPYLESSVKELKNH